MRSVPTKAKLKRPTQAERNALSEHEILKAAVTLIAHRGSTDWTLTEVGEAAGYTGGLVSHRFGSKSGLLRAVTDRIVELFVEKNLLQQTSSHTAIEQLNSFFQLYVRQILDRSDLFMAFHRLMADSQSTQPQLRPTFEKINERLCVGFASVIERGQLDRSIKSDINPAFEALRFTATFRGLTNLWLTGPNNLDLLAFADNECLQLSLRLSEPST